MIIATIGIANTLSLSVHERTRELGLLRAVGETRRQTRAMIRWEAVLVSVFGTVGGIALGDLPRLGDRGGRRQGPGHRHVRGAARASWP